MSTISIFLLLSGGSYLWCARDKEEGVTDVFAIGSLLVGAALGALHLLVTACDWLFVTFLL